jgi:hypothetical protein
MAFVINEISLFSRDIPQTKQTAVTTVWSPSGQSQNSGIGQSVGSEYPLVFSQDIIIERNNDDTIRGFSVYAINFGTSEIKIYTAVVSSGINGEQLPLVIYTYDSKGDVEIVKPSDANPIPRRAVAYLHSGKAEYNMNLADHQFMQVWGRFSVIINYQGIEHRIYYNDSAVEKSLIYQYPYVSKVR